MTNAILNFEGENEKIKTIKLLPNLMDVVDKYVRNYLMIHSFNTHSHLNI